jgi:type II secretory pathway pseudopilin PulG
VLAVIAIISIAATAFIHMTVYSVSKAVEETTKTKYASGVIGQAITVDDWEITVLDVKEAKYLKSGDSYYVAEEGQKAVIVTLRIKNIGKETKTPSDIWSFVLVTNANKSYEDASIFKFEPLFPWNITDEVKTSAVTVNTLDRLGSLAPGTYIEGDVLFTIPQNETPQKLHLKVGIIGSTEVSITLIR